MRIHLFIESENKNTTLTTTGKTIRDVLRELDINPVVIVASLNGVIVPETTPLKNGDTLALYSVVSGG